MWMVTAGKPRSPVLQADSLPAELQGKLRCKLDHKEGWTPKNWCFWIMMLEKDLESPLDYKEIKPSIIKEINFEYSLEGLMLKLQYFGHLMRRVDSLEKTLMLRKIEG